MGGTPAAAKVTVKDASGKEVTKLEDEGIYTIEIAAADDDAALNYTFPTEVSITVADEANLKFADNVDSSAGTTTRSTRLPNSVL